MEFSDFIERIDDFTKVPLLQKVAYAFYYADKVENKQGSDLKNIVTILTNNRCTVTNLSRLRGQMKSSKHFVKCKEKDFYTLSLQVFNDLDSRFSTCFQNNTEVISSGLLLDESKFKINRTNINKLVDQINHCYEHNCYDACAVLMRKLFETVLILAYENLQIASEIKDSTGNYYMLESISGNAKNNLKLNLSREPKKSLDRIRDVGNYSAHNIYYNATKKDIDDVSNLYRLVMEELYYKAGFMQGGLVCVS